jgi:hypothetical protein
MHVGGLGTDKIQAAAGNGSIASSHVGGHHIVLSL